MLGVAKILNPRSTFMNYKELVYSSRTNRSFDESRIISREELVYLVDLARHTPAAMNMQPLKFRLVYEKEELDKTLSITAWGGALPELKLPPDGHAPTAYIIICHDTNVTESSPTFLIDVGIVAQTMMLGATDMGLRGCILGSAKADDLKKVLGLSDNLLPKLTIALGKGEDRVEIVDAKDGNIKYFRDENNTHFVPKRTLEEMII